MPCICYSKIDYLPDTNNLPEINLQCSNHVIVKPEFWVSTTVFLWTQKKHISISSTYKMAYLKLSISVTCIGNNYYHDETKSHRCVVLLGDGSIELFEEGTLIKKMILFSDYNQELNKICIFCADIFNRIEKSYHPANSLPPFSMTSKVVLNKFEFLNMLDHLRSCNKLRPKIRKWKIWNNLSWGKAVSPSALTLVSVCVYLTINIFFLDFGLPMLPISRLDDMAKHF
jgi:hypothetical protein